MGNVNMEAYQIHTTDPEAPTVQKSLDNLKMSETQTAEALAVKADRIDIAPTFSTESAYSAGAMVYHSNHLYKFITDHAAGAWNAEEVEETNIDMAIQEAGGGGASLPDYSTTEYETGRKWIDGKDVYGIVFDNIGSVALNSNDWTDVVALNASEVISISVITTDNTLNDGRLRWNYSNGYIRGAATSNISYNIAYIIVEYTKSA